MPRQLHSIALAALLALPTQMAVALTFGRVASAAFLGQPLDFSVVVQIDEHEDLIDKCVSADVVVGDKRLPVGAVRVAVEPGSSPAERRVRVVSSVPIDQPLVSANVLITCPKRLAQSFIVFVNPSTIANAQPIAAADAASGAERPAAAIEEEAAQRAKERERLVTLEESLAKLRAEHKDTLAKLALLQAHAAEQRSDSNQLVFALAMLSLALACTVGALLWKRRPGGHETPRYDAGATTTSEVVPHSELQRADTRPEAERHAPEGDSPAQADAPTSPMPLAQALQRPESDLRVQVDGPPREMTVDELIDLEQQVEFFLVLGQVEDAVGRLTSQVDSGCCVSPLPYLSLLDILHRRGDRESHQRIRERFEARFNTPAPGWTPDAQPGLGVEADASLVEHLQTLWPQPTRAMETLAAWLLRRDTSGPIFDLSTYRDLLHLYSVARDLGERERPHSGVDLLLPFDSGSLTARPPPRAYPTRAGRALPNPAAATDVDIVLP